MVQGSGTLDKRKGDILRFIVKDFGRTAVPVSSERIFKMSRLGISPATIRNIMMDLEDSGLIRKPHTSGGRIPTDSGYRHFVDGLSRPSAGFGRKSPREDFDKDIMCGAVHEFAKELKLFASAISFGEEIFHEQAGFGDIFSEPEFQESSMLAHFGRLVDDLENVMEKYRRVLSGKDSGGFDIWIGEENISRDARCGSSLAASVRLRSGDEAVFFAFGPKRMDYEKAISKIIDLLNQ
ncbi:hypothetical protein HYT01_02300 [Candidatus Giovannonibacteria bacterium]|nr:hypothetical protein [Candidatus Giovannonibacteria bacterium]